MHVPFTMLPAHCRIWIYQADRELTLAEEKILSDVLAAFCDQWMVHGQPMETSFEIRYNQFVILAANDQASGCSIDSSVRVVKEVGSKLGVDFFNRGLVAFLQSDRVKTVSVANLKEAFTQGQWNASTLTFNNLIDSKADLEKNWILLARASWLKRFLPSESVVG